MATQTAVLIDERDRRIGKLQIPQICSVIEHNGCTFVRTPKSIRLHHTDRAFAVVFDQTEVYIRPKLETI